MRDEHVRDKPAHAAAANDDRARFCLVFLWQFRHRFDPAKLRQFDHGYAVTSHSSQGLTQDRVLANFDTGTARSLVKQRMRLPL